MLRFGFPPGPSNENRRKIISSSHGFDRLIRLSWLQHVCRHDQVRPKAVLVAYRRHRPFTACVFAKRLTQTIDPLEQLQ